MPTTNIADILTPAQQREALALANDVRRQRAALWTRWRDLDRVAAFSEAAMLTETVPSWAATWKVETMLCRLPRVGPSVAREILLAAGIDPRRRLKSLTDRQRVALRNELAERA